MRRIEIPAVNISKIESYLYCPQSCYLDSIVKESGLPMTGFFAKYFRQKEAIDNLYPMNRYVGPDLKHIESLDGKELAKYLSHESPKLFGKSIKNQWIQTIINQKGKVHGREIVWFPGQWIKAMNSIGTSCENYYKFIMQEGPPILAYNYKDVAFIHKGVKYTVRFDSLRKGLVVCKYSSSNKTKTFLENDLSITMKFLAFCTLAHDEEAYRKEWDVDPKITIKWGGNKYFIGPEVSYRYYNLSTSEITEVRRSDDDISSALQIIEDTQNKIDAQDFFTHIPEKRKCAACKFNIKDKFDRPICPKKPKEIEFLRHFEIAPIYHAKRKGRSKGNKKSDKSKSQENNSQPSLF